MTPTIELRDYERAFLLKCEAVLDAEFIDARLWHGELYLRLQSNKLDQQVLVVPDGRSVKTVKEVWKMPWGQFCGPWKFYRESRILAMYEETQRGFDPVLLVQEGGSHLASPDPPTFFSGTTEQT